MNIHLDYLILTPEGIPQLLRMMEDFYSIDQYPFNPQTTEQLMHEFAANAHLGTIWTIINKKETIGYIILTFCFSFEFKGRTAFIDELYLTEAYRSRGIGGQVVNFAIQQAKELSLKALHLEVEPHNEKGNKLYLNKGFKLHNRFLMTKRIEL